MEYYYWFGNCIDPDFDVMFSGPIDPSFQEEPYRQRSYGQNEEVNGRIVRNAVVTKPAIGKHSVWPEERRTKQ